MRLLSSIIVNRIDGDSDDGAAVFRITTTTVDNSSCCATTIVQANHPPCLRSPTNTTISSYHSSAVVLISVDCTRRISQSVASLAESWPVKGMVLEVFCIVEVRRKRTKEEATPESIGRAHRRLFFLHPARFFSEGWCHVLCFS